MVIQFTVEGRPVPFMRHIGKGRRAFNPPRYSVWRTHVALVAHQAMQAAGYDDYLDGDLVMHLVVRVPDRRYGDIDNYAKGIADACEGIVYGNDRVISEMHISRVISSNAGVDVTFVTQE